MSFRHMFKKTNSVHEAAKDFASCSCFANKTKNIALIFRYCLLCSVCFFVLDKRKQPPKNRRLFNVAVKDLIT